MSETLLTTLLAARNGDEHQFVQLIFFAILGVIFILGKLLNKGTSKSSPSPENDEDESESEVQTSRAGTQGGGSGMAAHQELRKALEAARHRYEQQHAQIQAAMRRLETMSGTAEMRRQWQAKIEQARRAAEQEYEDAKRRIQRQYASRIDQPTAPKAPVKPRPQPQPQLQPQHKPKPVASAAGAPVPQKQEAQKPLAAYAIGGKPVVAQTAAVAKVAKTAADAAKDHDVLVPRVMISRDNLAQAVLYSEILGKPLALREPAEAF